MDIIEKKFAFFRSSNLPDKNRRVESRFVKKDIFHKSLIFHLKLSIGLTLNKNYLKIKRTKLCYNLVFFKYIFFLLQFSKHSLYTLLTVPPMIGRIH